MNSHRQPANHRLKLLGAMLIASVMLLAATAVPISEVLPDQVAASSSALVPDVVEDELTLAPAGAIGWWDAAKCAAAIVASASVIGKAAKALKSLRTAKKFLKAMDKAIERLDKYVIDKYDSLTPRSSKWKRLSKIYTELRTRNWKAMRIIKNVFVDVLGTYTLVDVFLDLTGIQDIRKNCIEKF